MACGRCTNELKESLRCTLPGAPYAPLPDGQDLGQRGWIKYHDPVGKSKTKTRLPTDMPYGMLPVLVEKPQACPWGSTRFAHPLVEQVVEAYWHNKEHGTPIPDDPQITQGVDIYAREIRLIDDEQRKAREEFDRIHGKR